jgi:lipoic acid synthetase
MTDTLPTWIRARKLRLGDLHDIRSVMARGRLHTVCDEARCPNRSECFSRGTATFLIMGDVCTRACRYCSIGHGKPRPLDPNEPRELASAAAEMKLAHVVVTSVDRDDLRDGGAVHFAAVVAELHTLDPKPTVEVLTPDFRADMAAIDLVLAARPEVYNHNIETVRRLYPTVRRQGRYDWALEVLAHIAGAGDGVVCKSGLIVGLGEERAEVEQTLVDLANAGCQIATVGQYLRPTSREVEVGRYWRPEEFGELEAFGRSIGLEVFAGPFVRSSYRAEEAFERLGKSRAATGGD